MTTENAQRPLGNHDIASPATEEYAENTNNSRKLPELQKVKTVATESKSGLKRSASSHNLNQVKSSRRSLSASKSGSTAQLTHTSPTKHTSNQKSQQNGGASRLSRFMSSDHISFNPLATADPDLASSARAQVERAIRERKVFTIVGGYKPVRKGLRRRNYVEKVADRVSKKQGVGGGGVGTDGEEGGDGDEEDGEGEGDGSGSELDFSSDSEDESPEVKNLIARIIRNVSPTFTWTTKIRSEDIRQSRSLYNHFPATWCFTTKNGLTQSIRDLPWHGTFSVDQIYPRCYRIGCEAERNSFIEDFKLTAAVGILKTVANSFAPPYLPPRLSAGRFRPQSRGANSRPPTEPRDDQNNQSMHLSDVDSNKGGDEMVEDPNADPRLVVFKVDENASNSDLNNNNCKNESENLAEAENRTIVAADVRPASKSMLAAMSSQPLSPGLKSPSAQSQQPQPTSFVPVTCLTHALSAARFFLREEQLELVDEPLLDPSYYLGLDESSWEEFLKQYYKVAHSQYGIEDAALYASECAEIIDELRPLIPMLDCEGVKNVWICKPGALSRGRGISCQKNLDEILKMVPSLVGVREGQLVVQRYIERPLLIYGTKFDIRQWFLVTDWNPLTIWFYRNSYVRLCSQVYTLDNLQPQYHLSNQSVQHHYENQSNRPKELPSENMLTSDEFAHYLREQGYGDAFEESIYVRMKDIIVSTMQCCQDTVENRKNSFELYGADFMLGEDLSVWLLEINCSPAMGATTHITKQFCSQVMEDTLKVVIDRKENKNADTGCFELAVKQGAVPTPQYTGQNLVVEGTHIKKPFTNVPKPLYVPQIPSRFNLTQRGDKSRPEDNNGGGGMNSLPTSLLSRSHHSLSAHHSRNSIAERNRLTANNPNTSDDSELGTNQNQAANNRFSRHAFDKNSSDQPAKDSLRHRSIPEIDSNSNLLKVPNYMLPKPRNSDLNAPKTIPIISADSNLIKHTAASKSKSSLVDIDQSGSGLGEAWGKMKMTPGQSLQPNVPPPPPHAIAREKPTTIPPKLTPHSETTSKYNAPGRLNTIAVTDFTSLRRRHQQLMSPKKQTLVFGLPGSKLRDPTKSYSVIEGSLVRSNQSLFIGNEYSATISRNHAPYHHITQNSDFSLLQRLAEAPRISTKKTLPVKIMYPKYRVPNKNVFAIDEKPVYFLAPVKSTMPFD